MKVEFTCDSGANIHSAKTETLDTVDDLCLDEGEWETYTGEEKYAVANEWAWANGLEIHYEELSQ